jgi:hypothetical protein
LSSTALTISRAIVMLVGAGALLMAIGGLTSGESLTDPVFPGGLALGALALAAAAWVEAAGSLRAILVWLGLAGLLITIAIIGAIALQTPSPDVLALFAIPSIVVLAAAVRMAFARVAAGALGRNGGT